MEIKTKCPICKLDFLAEPILDSGDRVTINCPRCKRFIITRTADSIALNRELDPKLSAWIRNRNEQRAEVPVINSLDLSAGLPDYSPREKQIILLQNIERGTAYPGKAVQITPEYDIPLAWASAEEEFIYYIISLIERGLLRKPKELNPPGSDERTFYVVITANGWDYLEQHERRIEERSQAFVAMSFSDDLKSIWESGIREAIRRAGYKPYRVDAEPHVDRIDVKIISEIKNSRFVVADVTEHKRGVYFEAGYALGMGIPVIWCVRKDDLKDVHFDTRQYNHIVWEMGTDLEEHLYEFICAVIGKGREV